MFKLKENDRKTAGAVSLFHFCFSEFLSFR